MKLNINLMKLIIQLSILLILIVMFFIISMVLYSAKYWPDVYNYINANITIKRIPKISEIETNIMIYDATEIYETTDVNDVTDITTEYYSDDDYFSLDEVESGRRKRRVEQGIDYSEVPTKEVIVDYIFDVHPERDLVKDLFDEKKLTTRYMEDVEILPVILNGEENLKITEDCSNTDVDEYIFPWVTAIFIKNQTSNQYDYYCDGALLSNTVIITAASCIEKPNATSDDILVILGKKSLRVMTNTEILSKIKEIHIHDNFTSSEHDIAILVMEEPVTLSDRVQRARLGGDRGKAATTGWAVSGNLTLIMIEDVACKDRLPENTFCAVYGNDVSVCPSYGGLYTMRQTDGWFLRGIRKADPTNKGFCEGRSLVYTDLKHYNDWINVFIQ